MMTLEKYERLTLKWSEDRGILKNSSAQVQTLKLVSEIGELADHVNKGRDVRDDIGDAIVCLTNIAALCGTDLLECWDIAYNDIKDRKGYLNEEGCFIKEGDIK